MNRKRVIVAIIFNFTAACFAATYYVSPDGNDANDGLSSQAPWKTLSYASSHLPDGSTLVLMDGTYIGAVAANRLQPPSGSEGAYTTVISANDGKAVIDGSQFAGLYDYPVYINGKSYIRIEGLAIRNNANAEVVFINNSDHVKFLRSSVINKCNYNGSIIGIYGDSHHLLLEDIWVAGADRYGIILLQPTSVLNQAPHQIILRRCVVRHDYRRRDDPPTSAQQYPAKGIQVYGAQESESVLVTRDVLLQNNIAIDFNYGEEYWQMEGGCGSTARVNDVGFYGNISLNIRGKGACLPDFGCSYPSLFSGFNVGGSRLGDGGNFTFINNVAWDASSGYNFSGGTSTLKNLVINQNTAGNMHADEGSCGPRGIYGSQSSLQVAAKNNLFYETLEPNRIDNPRAGFSYIEDYNWYYPASLVTSGAQNCLTTDPGIRYITQTTDNGSGESGAKRGAEVLLRYGVSGTLWGEPGYDQLTEESLWPFPYEDQIKEAFSETNDPPLNAYPASNNVKRGFCADGRGLYGGPITLTSYIWEYLGNAAPGWIYPSMPDTTPPAEPAGLNVE
ncbi:MAG: hypothetical protein A2293_05055 [Elusimicrobia bacterium RIFOXYB2_FULL_49_7]|nr:MAG: hypothetical protein A2293_05055 [Elusimicrobia bacterium RIFOXYB2_FULL_49_7]